MQPLLIEQFEFCFSENGWPHGRDPRVETWFLNLLWKEKNEQICFFLLDLSAHCESIVANSDDPHWGRQCLRFIQEVIDSEPYSLNKVNSVSFFYP